MPALNEKIPLKQLDAFYKDHHSDIALDEYMRERDIDWSKLSYEKKLAIYNLMTMPKAKSYKQAKAPIVKKQVSLRPVDGHTWLTCNGDKWLFQAPQGRCIGKCYEHGKWPFWRKFWHQVGVYDIYLRGIYATDRD